MTERTLPSGWTLVELGSVALDIKNGVFATRPSSSPPGTPILRISAVKGGRVEFDDLRYVEGLDEKRTARHVLRTGDILVTRYNGTRRLVGVAGLVRDVPGEVVYPDKLIRVSADSTVVLPEYLCAVINSPIARSHLEPRIRTTAGQSGIAGPDLRTVPVPLPPLSVQRDIIGALDRVNTQLSALTRSVATAERSIGALETSLLRSLLDGPWPHQPLSQVASVQLGRQRSPKDHQGSNMIPYLRAANATWRGLDLNDVKQMNFSAEEVETFRLLPGDVLLNEASGSPSEVGKPVLWNAELSGDVCFQNTLIRVRTGPQLHSHFAYMLLRRLALEGFWAGQSRGVGIAHIGAKRLTQLDVPVPPVEVQVRLAGRYSEAMDLIRPIEAQMAAVSRKVEAAERAALAAAVAGRLRSAATSVVVPTASGTITREPAIDDTGASS